MTPERLIARKDRVFKLLNAEKVIPTAIENRLAGMNPYIRHVIVAGDGQSFLAALIFPDLFRIREEFGSFDAYMWSFVGGRPIVNELRELADYPATSRESDEMSRDLRRRGFKFVGSTVCYAHMQAIGMVNDHTVDCFRRREIIEGYERELP